MVKIIKDGEEQGMDNEKKELKAAVAILMDTVLSLLQDDPHQWSSRPCPTCRAISAIISKPFGCYLYAIKRHKDGKE